MRLNESEVFAGYTIRRPFRSGRMGEARLAEHLRLPCLDTLQSLPANLAANREFRERFNRETDLAPIPSPTDKRRRQRPAVAVPVLLAVLLLTAAVFAGVSVIGTNKAAAIPPGLDSQHHVDAAKTMAQALTTIDYRSADRDVQRILDNATGTFYDDFKSRSADFIQVVQDAQSTSTGTITEAVLESLEGRQARVLVDVTVTTRYATGREQETRTWRIRVTVQEIGDRYKASNVEFVQ